MKTESTVKAMLVVLSAVFESLPPEIRRRTVTLIEDCAGFVDDPDARELMRAYDLVPVHIPNKKPAKKARRRRS
jgi:hypothetical protein